MDDEQSLYVYKFSLEKVEMTSLASDYWSYFKILDEISDVLLALGDLDVCAPDVASVALSWVKASMVRRS